MAKRKFNPTTQYSPEDAPKTLKGHPFYGLNLDPEQEVFRDAIWNPERKVIICNAKAGTGKAQPLSTVIPTPKGPKYLGDIKVGDYVFDRMGNPTQVLGVFPQGKQRVYRLTISDGRSTLCSPDHLWMYMDYWNGTSDRGEIWKVATTAQLLEKPLTTNNGSARYKIPNNLAVEYFPRCFLIDPYVIGVFLGDGCCLERALSISNPEEAIVNEVGRLIHAQARKNSGNNYTWTFIDDLTGKPVHTKEFFEEYSQYLIQYSGDKRIPPVYLLGSIRQRLCLLQGLLDTDGSITYGEGRYNVTYSTTSTGLMQDILQLAYGLGIGASISMDSRTDKYSSGICYTIHFRVPNDVKPYLFRACAHKYNLALKSTEIVKKRNYDYNNIIAIEDLGYEDDMVCIYVDNPEHVYLTNDFIVTHNTTISLGVANLLYQYGFYDGIVYVMFPTQEQRLGYLPGTLEEKAAPYMQALCDACYTLGLDPAQCIINEDNIQAQKEGKAYIQFTTDTFMRGINIENKVVIVDECQNSYLDILKKVLTRCHDSDRVILAGHSGQVDLVKRPERSGFVPYINAFRRAIDKGETRAQICELTHNHRGWISSFCDNVYYDQRDLEVDPNLNN